MSVKTNSALCCVLVAAVLPALAAGTEPEWATAQGFSLAPRNPDFDSYLSETARGAVAPAMMTDDGHALGYIPPPIKLPPTVSPTQTAAPRAALPATFDLRTTTPAGVTAVRDQGACGSCWAFGTMSAFESALKYKRSITSDFSEADLNENHGFDFGVCRGGNWWMSMAYLTRWAGPVTEADVPYPYWFSVDEEAAASRSESGEDTASLADAASERPAADAAPGVPAAYHVQNVYLLESAGHPMTSAEIATLKQAVMKNGAMNVHYFHNNTYYDPTNQSFYNDSNTNSNHSVAIVGWNDNFAKTKFATPPPGNGAFIVKNSWGTEFGDQGYFYISYYDKSLGMGAQFLNAEAATNYTRIYQYDPLGWTDSFGYGSGTKTMGWFSNVFMASANASKIKSVSFYTPVLNATYSVFVYRDVTPDQPRSGTLASSKTGTLAQSGYNTITLPKIATVTGNKPFSVVVKLTTPGYNWPIPIEYAAPGYSTAASSAPGQSYVSHDGKNWYSAGANFNVNLKAFAVK